MEAWHSSASTRAFASVLGPATFLKCLRGFNANLKFTTDGADESDDMLKKAPDSSFRGRQVTQDLPLRYTWSIWEQIMQSNDKSSAYSDATHKAFLTHVMPKLGRWPASPRREPLSGLGRIGLRSKASGSSGIICPWP